MRCAAEKDYAATKGQQQVSRMTALEKDKGSLPVACRQPPR